MDLSFKWRSISKKRKYWFTLEKTRLKHTRLGINIKRNESGNNISKQMNTWALISNWSQDDFQNELLVNIFEFFGRSSWLEFSPVETVILLWKSFIMLLFFLRCPFSGFFFLLLLFHFFHCFAMRLRTWTLFKMNKKNLKDF